MAVTAVKSDGWAIEHTNLRTIRLVDAGLVAADITGRVNPAQPVFRQGLNDSLDS